MTGHPRRRPGLILFLAGAAILMGALVYYTFSVRPPLLPADRDHLSRDPVDCLRCHGPGGTDPRGPNHPLNDRCFECHERP
ncbi:MAG: hypothetical protein V3U83_02390 [Acidobacteriota bacterium]